MECGFCGRAPVDGVLVDSVQGAGVCAECAHGIALAERAAMVPLVVAGLAVFFDEWREDPDDLAAIKRGARRFWAELECFEEIVEPVEVAGALEVLLHHAPDAPRR
jgi:hypothetical protein